MIARLEKNREFVRRYTDQPETLPAQVRAAVEAAWQGEVVQLYALADLDASLRLARTWVCMGPTQIALYREHAPPEEQLTTFARSRVKKVVESPGLSLTTLSFLASEEEPALALVRYSQRQRGAMGAISFVLQQALEGNALQTEEADADAIYAESLSEPIKKSQSNVEKGKLAVVWRLVAYLKPYKWHFVFGVLGAAAFTILTLIPPLLMGRMIDDIVQPFLDGTLSREEALRMGWWIIAALVGIYAVREFCLWVRLRTLTVVGEYVARDLRHQIYDHLHRLSLSFFSHHQTGSLISRVGSDTDRIWDFIAFGVAELLLGFLMILGLAVVLITLDWQLGLILTLPVPLIFYFILWMGKKLHRIFLRIWRKWSEMQGVLSDTIPGMRVVQAFNQSNFERGRFNVKNEGVTDEAVEVSKVWTSHWPIIFVALNILTLIVWVFALPRMIGEAGAAPTLTVGDFVVFLSLMAMFVAPLEQFGFLTRMINRSISSAYRVFEVLDTEPEIVEKPDPKRLDPVEGRIEFEDVTFGYDPVRQILKGISFTVEPGEMIGLVGPSGAGKTTVINLIARFYDVHNGRVLIDQTDVRDLDLGHYRAQIGMVMQDPYLFHGTILDNIRYGMREASPEEVVAAAKAANAHDFILKLPNSYETIVGERGHTLSGGERQRVSIARAILHNPRLLILDEATSSVDTETERKIQEAIDRLVEGRTVIAIAHRLSTLSKANRLIVMKDGKIVEIGRHEELLAKEDGLYRKLHSLQRELHEMYAV